MHPPLTEPMLVWYVDNWSASVAQCANWRWWPGTDSWYQVLISFHSGNRVRPNVGSHVRPGREKSGDGRV